MAQRILVTGGAGFVGSHLVELLVSDGARVSVIDDLSRGQRAWLPADAELHEIDLRDADAVGAVLRNARPDVVVHLAAMHFIPAVDGAPELAWDVNVNATRVLVDALAARPPERLLFASTAAVYPDREGPIGEAEAPEPLDLYGRTKLEGERLVAELAAETGMRAVVARIFNVVGRRETNAHVVPELIGQLRGGSTVVRLGNLDNRRDYTDVRDVADALHRLLSVADGSPGTFNVGAGRSTSVAELVRICEEILDRRVEIESREERRRSRDRAELVADARLLRATTAWEPRWTLRETLADLLEATDASLPRGR
jgi:UDP-glucose 4-epimerase